MEQTDSSRGAPSSPVQARRPAPYPEGRDGALPLLAKPRAGYVVSRAGPTAGHPQTPRGRVSNPAQTPAYRARVVRLEADFGGQWSRGSDSGCSPPSSGGAPTRSTSTPTGCCGICTGNYGTQSPFPITCARSPMSRTPYPPSNSSQHPGGKNSLIYVHSDPRQNVPGPGFKHLSVAYTARKMASSRGTRVETTAPLARVHVTLTPRIPPTPNPMS